MGHLDHGLGHIDVVIKVGRGLAVFHQRAVHHDRAEAQVERTLADLGAGAVVLVHDQRNVGPLLGGGLDEVLDEGLTGVFAGTGAGLQNHRGTHLIRGLHDSLDLLQVVDVEGRNAVAVFGGVVQQFAHRDECHVKFPRS